MKLCLGTVQLGCGTYGINRNVEDQHTALNMYRAARDCGVEYFDCSFEYGDSLERLLYAIGKTGSYSEPKLIVKLNPNDGVRQVEVMQWFRDGHDCRCLMSHGPTGASFKDLWGRWCERLGCSVYSPQEAQAVSEWADVVQLPYNVLDQRLKDYPDINYEPMLRSIFLQGLLLMKDIPPWADRYVAPVQRKAAEYGISTMELCLWFVESTFPNTLVSFGADSPRQIEEVAEVAKKAEKKVHELGFPYFAYGLQCDELRVIDPRFW